MTSLHLRLAGSAIAFAAFAWHAPVAHACGGCFHPPPQPMQDASVITDHRMALSVSTTQTVLWDQIRYQGNPSQFAWVLPVGKGATIELARDEWLATLDAITSPIISAPPLPARCNSFGGGSSNSGFGCGAAEESDSLGESADGAAAFDSGDGVDVISQEVVGPYDAVTIHSSSGEAITKWLTDNGFDIPTNVQPILDAYTNEGFDFIALRLAPNQGVQAMQPVRVTTPGADPTIPLRMVSAGIGSSVGLTLYVIGEGRYESASFPALLVDRSKVVWDPVAQQSNYAQLFNDVVTSGMGWVTESSVVAGSLSSTYQSTCMKLPPIAVPCTTSDAGTDDAGTMIDDAGDDASDDAASDADMTDASDASDASDAGPPAPDASTCVTYVSACTLFTDYAVATTGLSPYDLRVTRLRTTLPASALTVDLKLRASSDQTSLLDAIQSTAYTTPNYDPCPGASSSASSGKEGCGCETSGKNHTLVPTSLALIGLASLLRRRRRR